MEQEPPDRVSTASHGPSAPGQPSHTLAAPVLRFDLAVEAEQLRRQEPYEKRRPTGKTLVKEPDLRIVLMALKGGARLDEHSASGPISVQVLQGTVRLRLADSSVELTQGDLLMLEPDIPHDVDAVKDAVFLLTIGRTTYRHVSDRHEPQV